MKATCKIMIFLFFLAPLHGRAADNYKTNYKKQQYYEKELFYACACDGKQRVDDE